MRFKRSDRIVTYVNRDIIIVVDYNSYLRVNRAVHYIISYYLLN